MIEIRIHGRGGQGAVIASRVLALAFFKEGKCVQAFPTFGVERRGAPVAAFTRVNEKAIKLRCQIYEPDHLIILDPTLIATINLTAGLKEGGIILINSEKEPSSFFSSGPYIIATVDANSIAVKHRLGSRTYPIVNTAILGAFSRVSKLVGIDAIIEAVLESIPVNPKSNASAAREAYEKIMLE